MLLLGLFSSPLFFNRNQTVYFSKHCMKNKLSKSFYFLPVFARNKPVVMRSVNLCVISSGLDSLDDLLWYCLILALSYIPQNVFVNRKLIL